ncbi:MAG: MFS transporter [Holosporaceae bacterium]|nr:MFS transporter [Holosporaceae bacterium]
MLQNNNNSAVRAQSDSSPIVIWLILLSFFFYQFVARSSFPTVLTEKFMEYFQLTATGVGALTSCYYVVYTIMQIPAGIINDRYEMRWVATAVSAISALGVFIFVATSNSYTAGLGQMMIGFGSAFAFSLTLKSIVTWFPAKNVVIMTSFSISIGSLGPVIGGPALSRIVKSFDWRSVLEVFALVGLVIAVLAWMKVRSRKLPASEKSAEISLLESLKIITTSPQLWVLSLFTMMIYSPLSALGDLWGISFIKKAYGVDATTAAFMNNMLYVGFIVGTPSFAALATFWNSYKKPMLLAIISATALFCLILSVEVPVNVAFVIFLFLGFSCGAVLAFPLALEIFPPAIGATVTGFVNMICMMGGVILMSLIGWILDLSWDGAIENDLKVYSLADYRCALSAVLVFLVVGIALALFIRDKSQKN